MYTDDANLNFTACSFPKLQHDMNVADSKHAHSNIWFKVKNSDSNRRKRARYLYKHNFAK